MADIIKTDNKYVVLIHEDEVNYVHSDAGMVTTYNDEYWEVEKYSTKQPWVDRLEALGIVDEELGINFIEEV